MRKRRRRRRLVQAVTLQEVRLERESQRWKWTAPRWLLPAGWTCRSRASRRRSAPDTTSGGQPSTVWYWLTRQQLNSLGPVGPQRLAAG